jgi:outer membrane protein assembly factor BamD (BamD/ComL family)
MQTVFIFITFLSMMFLTGCNTKTEMAILTFEQYNTQIIKDIKHERFDEAVRTLQTMNNIYKRVGDNHLFLQIAEGYSEQGEIEKANALYNLYLQKYATPQEIPHIYFKKIESYYLSLKWYNRDQVLILKLLKEMENFIQEYEKDSTVIETNIIKQWQETLFVKLNIIETSILKYYQKHGSNETTEYLKKQNIESVKTTDYFGWGLYEK